MSFNKNLFVVTTTINNPTKATKKFASLADKKDFIFVIVGDTKTPHDSYYDLVKNHKNVIYLDPAQQEQVTLELSNLIGWKTIQRRNIGFVFAYNQGAEIIASVDDDNIPYDSWGDNILVNKHIELDYYWNVSNGIFDPYSVTNNKHVWQRGYPIEYIRNRSDNHFVGKMDSKVLIQNDLCDGDSDYDAIGRLLNGAIVKFDKVEPFSSTGLTPFNSQNTFLSREVFPHYSVWPFCGRMDDIWAGYYTQIKCRTTPVFCSASVYQERNTQDLVTNLENEICGIRYTKKLLDNRMDISILPNYNKIQEFIDVYSNSFK